jgi:hypothetical protein
MFVDEDDPWGQSAGGNGGIELLFGTDIKLSSGSMTGEPNLDRQQQ